MSFSSYKFINSRIWQVIIQFVLWEVIRRKHVIFVIHFSSYTILLDIRNKIFGIKSFVLGYCTIAFFHIFQFLNVLWFSSSIYKITNSHNNSPMFLKDCYSRRMKSCLGHNVIWMYYKTVHLCFCFGAGAGQRTALIASSKTVLSPLVVRAEHSKYLTAPTSLAIERPCK